MLCIICNSQYVTTTYIPKERKVSIRCEDCGKVHKETEAQMEKRLENYLKSRTQNSVK